MTKKNKPFDYPKVKYAPEGYPSLIGMVGHTWYERACNYERKYGKPVQRIIIDKKEEDGDNDADINN